MSLKELVRERTETPEFQEKLVDRLLEPVETGGKFGDILKLYETLICMDCPAQERPLRQYSDGELWDMLERLTARGVDAIRQDISEKSGQKFPGKSGQEFPG